MSDSNAIVKRDGASAKIEGVPELAWGKSGECTFVGALTTAASVTLYPCDYASVMVATGLAFRVRWFEGKGGAHWCPSSPVGEMAEEIDAARKATGWTLREEWDWHNPLDRFKPDVVASIDAGLPVLCYDPGLNVAVICGYDDDGDTVLVLAYGSGPEPKAYAIKELKATLIFLESHTAPLSSLDAAINGFRMAVHNWNRRHEPPSDDENGYWFGEFALSHWRDAVGGWANLADEQRNNLFFVSWWCYDSLIDARAAGLRFLLGAESIIDVGAREDLFRAASALEREVKLLETAFTEKNAFLGPWSGKTQADWTEDVRMREQEILASMRKLDASAITEIDKLIYAGE